METDFRLVVKHMAKPATPYRWEIQRIADRKCIKRGYRDYPTRGAARKAGRRTLLRMLKNVARSGGPTDLAINKSMRGNE